MRKAKVRQRKQEITKTQVNKSKHAVASKRDDSNRWPYRSTEQCFMAS